MKTKNIKSTIASALFSFVFIATSSLFSFEQATAQQGIVSGYKKVFLRCACKAKEDWICITNCGRDSISQQ